MLSRKIAEISIEKAHNGVWQKSGQRVFRSERENCWDSWLWSYWVPSECVSGINGNEGRLLRHYQKLPLGNADQVDSLEELLKIRILSLYMFQKQKKRKYDLL